MQVQEEEEKKKIIKLLKNKIIIIIIKNNKFIIITTTQQRLETLSSLINKKNGCAIGINGLSTRIPIITVKSAKCEPECLIQGPRCY